MTDRLDLDARLARYLADEAPTSPPERLIHATRDRIAETPQRRGLDGLRWPSATRPVWRAALAGALALGIVAIILVLPGQPNSTPGSSASASPRLSASPSSSVTTSTSSCLAGRGTCLGDLQPGTYSSTSFTPTVRYTVPAGWTNTLDAPVQFDLRWSSGGQYTYPDGLIWNDGVSIFRQPVANSPTSASSPEEGIGTTANDLAQWLARHGDLTASAPAAITISEASGYRLVLSIPTSPRVTPDHCTEHGEERCVSLFMSDDPLRTFGFGLVGPEIAVVYLLDLPQGDTVMVVIDDFDGVDQPDLEAAAESVVGSLVFSP